MMVYEIIYRRRSDLCNLELFPLEGDGGGEISVTAKEILIIIILFRTVSLPCPSERVHA